MSPAQNKLYYREWGAVRKMLRAEGLSPSESDKMRHKLHEQALGADKSSKEFTNSDLDKVLAIFRAKTRPTDTAGQIRQLQQGKKRYLQAFNKLVQELNLTNAYIDGIARKICKKPIRECSEKDFRKLIAALNAHKRRQAKKIAPFVESESTYNGPTNEGDPF